MITQLSLELLKLVRSKGFYLSFAALSAFVLLMLWGFYSYAQQKTTASPLNNSIHLRVEELLQRADPHALFTGVRFQSHHTHLRGDERGRADCSERRAGTLRMICIRPVSRVSIVLSKFLLVAIHTYLLLVFSSASTS